MNDKISLHPEAVMTVLERHAGAANGLTARQLVLEVLGISDAAAERQLRSVIEALRTGGFAVGSHPVRGYFLIETDAELDATCEFLLSRAMTSLRQIARMKGVAMPDLHGQLKLPMKGEAQ